MFIMKSKIQFYSFIFFVALFSCTENSPSSRVGDAVTATVQVPEEGVDLEYLWEFKNLPDNSNISNSDIQAGDDKISVIFIPDVSGNYGLEVSIFQYNDEISTQSFNFDVIGEEMVALNEDIVNTETQIPDDSLKSNTVLEAEEPKWYDSESISELVIAMEKDSINSEPIIEKVPKKEVKITSSLPSKKPTAKKRTITRGKSIPFDKNRFTIQIASKKILADAKKVAVELIDTGYDAYIQKALFVESKETWYRIRVGSYDKKETAIAVAKTLSKNRREKAWVDYVRYER